MLKTKTAVATPQAYSKETDEMKMRKSLSKLADLSREALADADVRAIESLLHEVKRLWAIFGEHCTATDSVVIRREPTTIEKARRDVANDDFAKALAEFLSYTPKTMEGISLKASLLLRETALSENIEDNWEIFAKSLTEVSTGERINPKENAGRATFSETSKFSVVELIKVHRAAATALKTVPAEVDYDDDCPEWVAENEAFEALLTHVPVNFDEVCLLSCYLRTTDDLLDRVMPASKTFWSWTLLNSLLSMGAGATEPPILKDLSKTDSPVEGSSAKHEPMAATPFTTTELSPAIVKPEPVEKTAHSDPADRFVSALQKHRVAHAGLENASLRDGYTKAKLSHEQWSVAMDAYLAATIELYSMGAYHDLRGTELQAVYDDYVSKHTAEKVSSAFECLAEMPEEWRLILLDHYRSEAAA